MGRLSTTYDLVQGVKLNCRAYVHNISISEGFCWASADEFKTPLLLGGDAQHPYVSHIRNLCTHEMHFGCMWSYATSAICGVGSEGITLFILHEVRALSLSRIGFYVSGGSPFCITRIVHLGTSWRELPVSTSVEHNILWSPCPKLYNPNQSFLIAEYED